MNDTREQLERSIDRFLGSWTGWSVSIKVLREAIIGWLDRQAAITEREYMGRIAELQAKLDKARNEREMYRECFGKSVDKADEIRAIMAQSGVKTECWAPLGQGNRDLLTDETITQIGERYGKTAAQVILRFEILDGMITLPKSVHAQRIRSNFEIFDFTLTDEEMDTIRTLDRNKPSRDPDAPGRGDYLRSKFTLKD